MISFKCLRGRSTSESPSTRSSTRQPLWSVNFIFHKFLTNSLILSHFIKAALQATIQFELLFEEVFKIIYAAAKNQFQQSSH